MAYGQKRKYGGATGGRFARRKVVKRARRTKFGPSRYVQPKTTLDTCFVKVSKMTHAFPTAVSTSGEIFAKMSMVELGGQQRFIKFASMYSYFRVHKMSIVINTQGQLCTCITSFDPDGDVPSTNTHQITASMNSRIHQLAEDRITKRTENLGKIAKFREFYSCQGASAALVGERLKATINYGFPGINAAAPGHFTLTVTESWVVEFKGLREKFVVNTLNHPALGPVPAIGPQDPIPQGLEP